MISCSITTSVLGCLVTSLLFVRYILFLNLSPAQKGQMLVLFLLAGCIPLFTTYQLENTLGCFYPLYRYFLYFLYVFCIILFTVTIFRDAVWSLVYGIGHISGHDIIPSPFSKDWLIKLNIASLVVSFIFAVSAFYQGTKTPDVKVIEITSDKIKQEQTIAVLSDLHIHRVICSEKIKKSSKKPTAKIPASSCWPETFWTMTLKQYQASQNC